MQSNFQLLLRSATAINPPTAPTKKQPAPSPVTLRQMPDGSYRIYGLRNHSRLHLTREMRSWRRDWDAATSETFYMSWDRHEAEVYADAHSLTIIGSTTS